MDAKVKAKTLARIKRLLHCDTARVSCYGDTRFLIIGWKRNTLEMKDGSQWLKSDEHGNMVPFHFTYVEEKVVASGSDESQLLANARKYKTLRYRMAQGISVSFGLSSPQDVLPRST